jgi:SAM-dependent methyltransferase
MDPAHLQELARLEEVYWWHVAKRQLAMDLVSLHAAPDDLIVEGGVGAAANLKHLQSQGFRVHGLDLMPEAISMCQQRGIANATQHDLCIKWPIQENSAKIVMLLDVLEHLPDPILALQFAAESLTDDGKIILTVPAWPSLYGDWDKRLGHYRRYSATVLRQHIQAAGLKLHWLNSWNAFTLPAALILRTWRRLFPKNQPAEFPPVSPFTNRLLITLAKIERQWMRFSRVPTGLSLVAVVSK